MRALPSPGVTTGSLFPVAVSSFGLFFLFLGFVVPVGGLLWESLFVHRGPAPWTDSFLLYVLSFTYGQALVSAILSGVVGIGAALLYSEFRFPGREFLWRISLLPFAMPTLLVALAIAGCWGKSGWFGRFLPPGTAYGWNGILLGHVFLNFALYLKGVGTALRELDRQPEQAALSLGASRLRCFCSITLPRLFPEIRTAFVLSFLYCSSSFLIVLMLGGGPRFTTLEVAVYQAIKINFDLGLAVRLAAIQALISACLYGAFLRSSSGPSEVQAGFQRLYYFGNPLCRRLCLAIGAILLGVLVIVPLLGLVTEGLGSLGSLDWSVLGMAAWHSLQLGILACVASLGIALPLAYGAHRLSSPSFRALIAWLASLPISVSTLLLTVGWMVSLKEKQDWLRGSLVPAAFIQGLIALPAIFRVLRDGFSRIPAGLYPAASSLGASAFHVLWSVEIPLMRRSLGLAAVLALAFSLGEVGAVLLFLGQDNETLPLWIFRLMGRYQFGPAYGASLLLLVLLGGIFWAVGRLEGDDVRTED